MTTPKASGICRQSCLRPSTHCWVPAAFLHLISAEVVVAHGYDPTFVFYDPSYIHLFARSVCDRQEEWEDGYHVT